MKTRTSVFLWTTASADTTTAPCALRNISAHHCIPCMHEKVVGRLLSSASALFTRPCVSPSVICKMIRLRPLQTTLKKKTLPYLACRCISLSVTLQDDKNKISDGQRDVVDNSSETSSAQRAVYPDIKVSPRIRNFHIPDENPFRRVKKAFEFDFNTAKAKLAGKPPPTCIPPSDILIIGGGLVGSSIAYHLTQATGVGLQVVVVEKDPPLKGISSSLDIASNGIYQQVKSKPKIEMAQYAVEFYRKLAQTFDDPDLPPTDVNFHPCSSLQLASEGHSETLEELSDLYQDIHWKHLLLSSSMLKKRFPWMNVDGISMGCLGMKKEGMCDQWKALNAMRRGAEKYSCTFLHGRVVGFEFADLSDYISTESSFRKLLSPCSAVVQTPDGELLTFSFGYVIVASGSSTSEVTEYLNMSNNPLNLPIKSQEHNLYEIQCSDGPGIDMPMILESNGLRFRKSDMIDNKYFIWKETHQFDNTSENMAMHSSNDYFYQELLPQVVKRVPSFNNAKLLSTKSGLVSRSTWDDNPLIGPLPFLQKVYVVGGLGYDEFLYAPAIGRGVAELVLESDYLTIDLSCYRFERIGADVKLEDIIV